MSGSPRARFGAELPAIRSTSYLTFERRTINGEPGLVMHCERGTAVLALVVDHNGHITQIDIVANPDKLRHAPPAG